MSNFFDHFTIVSNIVKYISWYDINGFKKLNSLCCEVCEREEARRCFGIQFGYEKLALVLSKAPKRPKIDAKCLGSPIICKNPRLVLIISNKKEKLHLLDLITDQCDSGTLICYVFSKHGTIGSTDSHTSPRNVTVDYSFCRKTPGLSWLCLPKEAQVDLLTPDSDILTSTKVVIVLNDSNAREHYGSNVLTDGNSPAGGNLVYYCGGLVNNIDLFNFDTRRFARRDFVCIAIGGDNLRIDQCMLKSNQRSLESMQQAFAAMKARNDEVVRRGPPVIYQCILVFSCFIRYNIRVPVPSQEEPAKPEEEMATDGAPMITEYELFGRYFPGVPICGVLCEGEIFRVNEGVVKLVRCLNDDDIDGSSSIFLLLTWLSEKG